MEKDQEATEGHTGDAQQEAPSLTFSIHPSGSLQGGFYDRPFMQEEAEVQRSTVMSPKSHSWKGWSQDGSHGLPESQSS